MIDAREEVLPPVSQSSGRRQKTTGSASRTSKNKPAKKHLRIERTFRDARVKPFDQHEWERRTAEITDDAGKVICRQENVEMPKSWYVLATKVVVSKYF